MMRIIRQLKDKSMKRSREKKLDHFFSMFQKGQTVLDVGVSSEGAKGNANLNYFLKHYPFDPETYTGLGVLNLDGMEVKYPGKRFMEYSGKEFPFNDKEFDWAFSNAVIEHVGNLEAQILFLNEMLRVANRVYFTTPYKYFPIETHTDVFFLHWNNRVFYRWCERNRPFLSSDNLYLFSEKHLKKVIRSSNAVTFKIKRNLFMGIPMTFTVVCNN